MNRIRLLSEQVANQIAAGEVIERPASVVKELVENSLDAESNRITVEIQAGGRSLIRITDDGVGMNKDDALMCLERHATSKIQKADDLYEISTMGFRGEALPSIASVSRFTLSSRPADDLEGTEVIVNGGKMVAVKSSGCAPGTTIEVRNLFFNIPARRKFLRTEETERAHIAHYLNLAALAHPHIAFTLIQNGRTSLQLPAATKGDAFDRLRERIRSLHGADLKLLSLDRSGHYEVKTQHREGDQVISEVEIKNIRVWGFIGAPGVSRSTRSDQNLFVNRRPIENRSLNGALIEGFHTSLMKGRYPVCCLFLELDTGQVDVNIHPAKREVKFHRERQVRQFVMEAVRAALLEFHAGTNFESAPAVSALNSPVTEVATPEPAAAPPVPDLFGSRSEPKDWPVRQDALPIGFSKGQPAESQPPAIENQTTIPPLVPTPLLAVPLRLIGVIKRLYVVLESDRGMVLMDQHAAHERILFEQMLARLEKSEHAPSQRLLLPETIELSARDAEFVRSHLDTLVRLGVELSEFGDQTFLLEALPPMVKAGNPRQFALELVDQLKAAGDSVNNLRLGEDVVAKTVCRHAVKANDALAPEELENLVNDLRTCQMPYTCPHGRPTLIEFSMADLEKRFGRVQ
ncbi:MAG: DNA mismatch repair endonuclease MutL [Limisphaerales bacterium]